jgi:beta-1,4-mannosyl-glycoprotein beta-1,4-N-acetylglucosaminyltransferase
MRPSGLASYQSSRHPATQTIDRMIFDCFPLFNELELLRLRLEELRDVIDWFVLVEGGQTFSGKPKPRYFNLNREQFADYNICHVCIDEFPQELAGPWEREAYTRNALLAGLGELGATPNDIIMLSDVDELPRPRSVLDGQRVLEQGHAKCVVLDQVLSYYFLNCRTRDPWSGTRMARFEDVTTMQELRTSPGLTLRDAGWHFSYLGGIDRIQQKIGATSHTDLDVSAFTASAHLKGCIEAGRDLFGREIDFAVVPLDSSFPKTLLARQSDYAQLIAAPDASMFTQDPDTGGPTAESLFRAASQIPSDISEHVDFLYRLASTVNHVTEFGVRTGRSTAAFLLAGPAKLVGYDLDTPQNLCEMQHAAALEGVDYQFVQADVLVADIESTDLLFIDTLHVEQQTRTELGRHACKVSRYIVLHDTETFGRVGECDGQRGIWFAVADFLRENENWRLMYHSSRNNGLTVLARLQQ